MQQNSGISLTFEPANRSSEMELILVYNVDSGFFNIVKNGLRAREVQPVKHKSHGITVLYYDRVKTRKIFDMGISNLRARAPTCGDLIRNPECEET